MTTGFSARQGDVLIIPATAVPPTAKCIPRINGRIVLGRGSASPHTHEIRRKGATLHEHDGATYLNVTAPYVVTSIHEGETIDLTRHWPIAIPRGTYRIIGQREMTAEADRAVED